MGLDVSRHHDKEPVEEYVLNDSLQRLEARFGGFDFLRVHRGALVNLGYVVAVQRKGRIAQVELQSGRRVDVARRCIASVMRRLHG
ncbi:MAG: LytTR family transcriptional regulator [Myxococcales bacterium FL481]|nr:MAG: LytTR family transcriptional regulator [Myxococcales bacterium FL481]